MKKISKKKAIWKQCRTILKKKTNMKLQGSIGSGFYSKSKIRSNSSSLSRGGFSTSLYWSSFIATIFFTSYRHPLIQLVLCTKLLKFIKGSKYILWWVSGGRGVDIFWFGTMVLPMIVLHQHQQQCQVKKKFSCWFTIIPQGSLTDWRCRSKPSLRRSRTLVVA